VNNFESRELKNKEAYVKFYSCHDGIDIKAAYGQRVFASIACINYVIAKDPLPIHVKSQREEVLKKRKQRVAGSIIFIQFDIESFVQKWDNIPSFDIILVARNKEEEMLIQKIAEVKLFKEGEEASPCNITAEDSFTFVAKEIIPWQTLESYNE
jgi:hypothetical protein